MLDVPEGMRAAYVTELGPADAIRVGELPVPAVGPTDVLVRVEVVVVNPVDTMVRSGAYPTPTPFPFVVGAGPAPASWLRRRLSSTAGLPPRICRGESATSGRWSVPPRHTRPSSAACAAESSCGSPRPSPDQSHEVADSHQTWLSATR
jgi:hypothetical protein